MGINYQPLGKARFRIEQTPEGERIRVPAQRQWFVLIFLCVWLTGWTLGGVAAVTALLTDFQPFVLLWLGMWLIGWVLAVSAILWMLAGSETLRVVHGDLEIAQQALFLKRRWLYQGSQIRALSAPAQPGWPFRYRAQIAFARSQGAGAVRFTYGARDVLAAAPLDQAEGQLIVDWLAARLPLAARD